MCPQPLPCVIRWDPSVFTEGARSLPAAPTLHTQLYCGDTAWSVVFSFNTPPVDQGLETYAEEVRFLVEAAPHDLLVPGFEFPFYDGGRIIASCTVLEPPISTNKEIDVLAVQNNTATIVIDDETHQASLGFYGHPGHMRDELTAAILSGKKTTTSSLAIQYGAANRPKPGDYEVVVDSTNTPICVIQILEVATVPFGSVPLHHVQNEGEDFTSIDQWASAHRLFWESPEFRHHIGDSSFRIEHSTEVVCTHFQLIGHVGTFGGNLYI